MFDAVLIANRGEIAIRVIRACKELGVRSVAVYSDADRHAPHVRMADEAYHLGGTPAADSYLNIDKILNVATQAGVDAIHPGYGFLAENADFAAATVDSGLVFIGPPAEAIRQMGDKLSARRVAVNADVPVVPGTVDPTDDVDVALAFGDEYGYPVAVKAMFGGGGRGMKVVRGADDMRAALEAAQREAKASFGRGECYLERYLDRARHVEIQVLADLDGTTIHLGDRDCSLQRRHQKLIEEAPAPAIDPAVRQAMGEAAIRVAGEMGYTNAGTCEFLLAADKNGVPVFYFLEMNTRLQVEHPVTELVTGVDLVHAQLRIASGDGMQLSQDDIEMQGHAIEVRINAEDPGNNFIPTPGNIDTLRVPLGPWVRFDSGVESGGEISPAYDSMIAKLIVWGADRDTARRRMLRALDEFGVDGVTTSAPFHQLALQHPEFINVEHTTASVETAWDLSALQQPSPAGDGTIVPGDTTSFGEPRDMIVEVNRRRFALRVFAPDRPVAVNNVSMRRRGRANSAAASASGEDLTAPMQGTVISCAVSEGDEVSTGDLIVVLEAMKMENPVKAHRDGVVVTLSCSEGDVVQPGAVLARIE